MKKKTKVEEESSKEISSEEMEALKNQNFSLQELHNLKDEAYYRVQVLNNLNRIALAVESLELGEEDSSEEENKEDEEE